MVKNGHVHEGRNVERSNDTTTKLFSVDSYNLKSMSFNFGIIIFALVLKCQGKTTRGPLGK
jgi:hypothetical protein